MPIVAPIIPLECCRYDLHSRKGDLDVKDSSYFYLEL